MRLDGVNVMVLREVRERLKKVVARGTFSVTLLTTSVTSYRLLQHFIMALG